MLNLGPLHLSGMELLIILVVVLLIFGPKNLPKLGNAIGRTVKNLRSGMEGDDAEDEKGKKATTAEAEVEDAHTEAVKPDEGAKSADKA